MYFCQAKGSSSCKIGRQLKWLVVFISSQTENLAEDLLTSPGGGCCQLTKKEKQILVRAHRTVMEIDLNANLTYTCCLFGSCKFDIWTARCVRMDSKTNNDVGTQTIELVEYALPLPIHLRICGLFMSPYLAA